MKPVLAIHLHAPSDKYGNPRGVYLVVKSDGNVEEVIDEGHDGPAAYRNKYGPLSEIDIATTLTEYKRWSKAVKRPTSTVVSIPKPNKRVEDTQFKVRIRSS